MIMETLLGLVKDGMHEFAVAWKPCWTNCARVGIMPSEIPWVRYSGSKPSTQMMAVGSLGRV